MTRVTGDRIAACLDSAACRSALGAAAVRAAWGRRVGAPPVDELAPAILGAVDDGIGWSDLVIDPERDDYHRVVAVLVRTQYVDAAVTAAVAGPIRQVVNLGAGFDTRPYRLDMPGETSVYDVDLPEVTRLKDQVLADFPFASRCRRVSVEADLDGPCVDLLVAAGLDVWEPVLWIAEGVLQDLGPGDAHRLLGAVDAVSVPGSRVVATSTASVPPIEADWLTGGADGSGQWTVHAVATEVYARQAQPEVSVPAAQHGRAGSLFSAIRSAVSDAQA